MRVEEGFQQVNVILIDPSYSVTDNENVLGMKRPYTEGNPYTTDTILPHLLKRLLPQEMFQEVHQDLMRFGIEVLTSTSLSCSPHTISGDSAMSN